MSQQMFSLCRLDILLPQPWSEPWSLTIAAIVQIRALNSKQMLLYKQPGGTGDHADHHDRQILNDQWPAQRGPVTQPNR